jgi:hypothetical protein
VSEGIGQLRSLASRGSGLREGPSRYIEGNRHAYRRLVDEMRREAGRARSWTMLLPAWGATIGRPAFITPTVLDILGSVQRSFSQDADTQANAAPLAGPLWDGMRLGR